MRRCIVIGLVLGVAALCAAQEGCPAAFVPLRCAEVECGENRPCDSGSVCCKTLCDGFQCVTPDELVPQLPQCLNAEEKQLSCLVQCTTNSECSAGTRCCRHRCGNACDE